LFEFNYLLVFWGLVLSLILYNFTKYLNAQTLIKNFSVVTILKLILFFICSISFIIYLYIFWVYINLVNVKTYSVINLNHANYLGDLLKNNTYSLHLNKNFSLNLVGLIFTLIAYLVGFLSFAALDTRLYGKNARFVFICYFLLMSVILFFSCNNIIVLFLTYELLLVPSFFFVYYIATSKRAAQAAIYFLIWTQIGSFLVLLVVFYVVVTSGVSDFIALKEFKFSKSELIWLYWLLFLGFGIKVPIWPAHYWITKTHVEAPAGFSMFLSGFLVKTAIFGFYKITNCLGLEVQSTIALIICYLGVLDASLKMWSQTDLKKLVAYSTIQEMNIIYIAFSWGDSIIVFGGFLFCITHALLSPLFFYLVDCVQRRYNSRSILEIHGLLQSTPNLAISIIIALILYSGLPGTLKFISEFTIFIGLLEAAPVSIVIILYLTNVIGLLGVLKGWFNIVFGLNVKDQGKTPVDLNIKEFLILYLTIIMLLLFNLCINIYF